MITSMLQMLLTRGIPSSSNEATVSLVGSYFAAAVIIAHLSVHYDLLGVYFVLLPISVVSFVLTGIFPSTFLMSGVILFNLPVVVIACFIRELAKKLYELKEKAINLTQEDVYEGYDAFKYKLVRLKKRVRIALYRLDKVLFDGGIPGSFSKQQRINPLRLSHYLAGTFWAFLIVRTNLNLFPIHIVLVLVGCFLRAVSHDYKWRLGKFISLLFIMHMVMTAYLFRMLALAGYHVPKVLISRLRHREKPKGMVNPQLIIEDMPEAVDENQIEIERHAHHHE